MRNIFTVLLTVLHISVFGQNFEGKIIYHNTYKSKVSNLTDAEFNKMMGTKQAYYIKGGNYKSNVNGTVIKWQLYINKDNKLYFKMSEAETIYWNDGNTNTDSVISVTINKGVTEVLGYLCDEVILTCKSGIQKYYFHEKLAVDISLYAKHKYGNWYDFLKASKALPLKSIIETNQFSQVSIAVEIKEMKLDAKEFQLPENTKTAKSPF